MELDIKKIFQKVLKKRNFWPIQRLILAFLSFKYLNYQKIVEYKLCIKKI